MVGLVVEDNDVLLGPEPPADAADHLFGRFLEGVRVAIRAGENLLRKRGRLQGVVAQEGVEVRDLDAGSLEGLELVGGDQIALGVVIAGEVRSEDLEPVFDRDARRDNEERVREAFVLGVGQLVQCLPGDEHPHDHGLAGAGRHLERDPVQAGVLGQVFFAKAAFYPGLRPPCDFCQEDGCLERLDLAEEERLLAGRIVPVVEEVARYRSDAAVVGASPGRDMLADAVDEVVVPDFFFAPGECQLTAVHFGLGDGHEVRAAATPIRNLVGNAVLVEPEVPCRLTERRVEDRIVDHD